MSGPVFVALVNPKSGGNVGAQLLERFREILGEERVYDLIASGGPRKALEEHQAVENLRIIGEIVVQCSLLRLLHSTCFDKDEITNRLPAFFQNLVAL